MVGPVLDDGGPAGAVDVVVTGRAAGAGSLISQSAPSPITLTTAAARTGMTARRARRPRASPAPISAPRFEMLVAGTFASWSRNPAAVGRSSGSLLRAVINTSIKCRL